MQLRQLSVEKDFERGIKRSLQIQLKRIRFQEKLAPSFDRIDIFQQMKSWNKDSQHLSKGSKQ